MRACYADRPDLADTAATPLPGLAGECGLRSVTAKDESGRFGLNAFKILGVRFAIDTMIASHELGRGDTLVCASEGNHGRAVARAARDAGCDARVYMAGDAAASRADAIAGEGATVIRVDGSYDDALGIMRADAAVNRWTIVSDTAWPGYERIPLLIMLGYTRMMDEAFGELEAESQEPSAVFVQGGVGGLLCAVASWCAAHRPGCKVISVEPTTAACLQASARAGRPTGIADAPLTAMAGLRTQHVSPLAFDSLLPNVDAFLAIDDAWAFQAMRSLAGAGIRAGASGSAALGGLLALSHDPSMTEARRHLALDASANVLVIVSEGVTDPALWDSVVGGR